MHIEEYFRERSLFVYYYSVKIIFILCCICNGRHVFVLSVSSVESMDFLKNIFGFGDGDKKRAEV